MAVDGLDRKRKQLPMVETATGEKLSSPTWPTLTAMTQQPGIRAQAQQMFTAFLSSQPVPTKKPLLIGNIFDGDAAWVDAPFVPLPAADEDEVALLLHNDSSNGDMDVADYWSITQNFDYPFVVMTCEQSAFSEYNMCIRNEFHYN